MNFFFFFPTNEPLDELDTARQALRLRFFGDHVLIFQPDVTVELILVAFLGLLFSYLLYRQALFLGSWFHGILAVVVIPPCLWFLYPAIFYFWGNVAILSFLIGLKITDDIYKKKMLRLAKEQKEQLQFTKLSQADLNIDKKKFVRKRLKRP